MKDLYPDHTSIPASALVPQDAQPDYADVDFLPNDGPCNVGYRLTDAHVLAGRADTVAAIHAESGRTYTFEELARQSTRLAAGLLKSGLKTGDRIAYRTVNHPDALIVMAAIWKAGGVVVPVPAQAKPTEIRHHIVDTGARMLFVHTNAGPFDEIMGAVDDTSIDEVICFGDGHAPPHVRTWMDLMSDEEVALCQNAPDQPAIIWHTGGTTGKPKGCYHTHRRFLTGGYAYGKATGSGPGQLWAAAAPIGHALGIIHHTIFSVLHGATAVFIERFADPLNLLSAIETYRLTTLTALTASWAKMADVLRGDQSFDISSLTRCFAMWQSASASDVFDFWLGQGVELFNNFGSTSFATWVLIPELGASTPRAALGKPIPGYTVEAVEIDNGVVRPVARGEIGQMAVRGPSGLTYWDLPNLQSRDIVDGWTLSDDLIQFDETGNAHYLGRTDYMISTGGFKVAPVEVEEVLNRHPAVKEVAVVPAPCPVHQEMIVAYIALRSTANPSQTLKIELREMVKAELSSYKAPRRIEFVDALPRDAVGKIQTKIVKQWAFEAAEPTHPPQSPSLTGEAAEKATRNRGDAA